MSKDFEVVINDPDRARFFEKIFGRTTLHVKSPIPERMNLPGKPDAEVFMLDLELITPAERVRLVAHIAKHFKVPAEEVGAALDREGLPILVDHTNLIINNPLKWFS